jgi:general secretion pathway protein D
VQPIRFALPVLALAAMAADPLAAQTAAPPAQDQAGDVVINMRGVEIADVADQIPRSRAW